MRSDTLYPEEVATEYEQELGSFSDYAFQIEYSHDQTNWYWELEYKDRAPGFRVDSGFVPRVDFRELEGVLFRRFWADDDAWYDRWDVGAFAERVEDHEGQLTDEELGIFGRFWGPLQTRVELTVMEEKEYFDGVLYENLLNTELYVEMQPSGAVKLTFWGRSGDAIDFSNNQPGDELQLKPSIEAKFGRHIIASLDHTLEKLDVEGGELFEANLSQLRLVYNFNVRIFVRAIVQNLDITRNPELYSFEVEPETQELFTQLLFSYQVNPRTVLFAGYSDNQLGLQDVSLTRTDRTFFFKIGYAWIL
jgi:citrate lyase gamma subunit